jgi:hypothetical protein
LLYGADEDSIVKDTLNVIISEVILFMNVGKTMTPPQIESTINMILSDVMAKSLTFEDYKVCFENAKKGHYGKSYDRLDGQIIFEWITAYFNEKTAIIEESNHLLHQNSKKDYVPPGEVNHEGVKKVVEVLRQAIKPISNAEVSNSNAEVKKTNVQDDKMKLIQRFLTQFDKLHRDKPHRSNHGRFINRYNKIMNQVEYSEYKLTQLERIKTLKAKKQ